MVSPTWWLRQSCLVTDPLPPKVAPGLAAFLRKTVLATAPMHRCPTVTVEELGLVTDPKTCFWDGKPILGEAHRDHVFGLVAGQRWTGFPDLTVFSCAPCNEGRGTKVTAKKLFDRLGPEAKVRLGGTPAAMLDALRAPKETVDAYNLSLDDLRKGVQASYDEFLRDVAAGDQGAI
jgi:hypothetical protein